MRHIILTTYVLKAPLMTGFSEQKHWQIACCEFITTSESCKWLRIINYGRLRQLWLDHRALSLGTDQESVPDSEGVTCHHFMMAAWHSNKSWTPVQAGPLLSFRCEPERGRTADCSDSTWRASAAASWWKTFPLQHGSDLSFSSWIKRKNKAAHNDIMKAATWGWVCAASFIIHLLPWMKSVVLFFYFAKIRNIRVEIAWLSIKLNVTVNGNNCVNAWLFVERVIGNAYFCADIDFSVFQTQLRVWMGDSCRLNYFYRLWPGPLKPANTEKMASPCILSVHFHGLILIIYFEGVLVPVLISLNKMTDQIWTALKIVCQF